jgi:hypothetical protein
MKAAYRFIEVETEGFTPAKQHLEGRQFTCAADQTQIAAFSR